MQATSLDHIHMQRGVQLLQEGANYCLAAILALSMPICWASISCLHKAAEDLLQVYALQIASLHHTILMLLEQQMA